MHHLFRFGRWTLNIPSKVLNLLAESGVFRFTVCAAGIFIGGGSAVFAQKMPIEIPVYTPVAEKKTSLPLKSRKLIFTESDIRMANENLERYASARGLRDSIVAKAEEWLVWEDQDIRNLIPDASVPRAFDLNINGCPVHGDTVFNIGGVYPWILDFRRPLTVKCPVGGEIYPSNDFHAHVKHGFPETAGSDGAFADYGWGWVAPDKERYWFVAYANEHLQRDLSHVLQLLSRAYVLTGKPEYAHKALVILSRIAEVYPSMDHANQSRYGAMMKVQGEDFAGKIFYHIQEARFIRIVAESYDQVWDAIDGDQIIQGYYKRTGEQMRAFIEANVLEEAILAYEQEKIQGNYGMHQNALLYTLLAREHPLLRQFIEGIVENPGQTQPRMGLRYTLYNQVFRDGMALESPEYNFDWIRELSRQMSLVKKGGGKDLFALRRSKSFFDSPLNSIVIGRYTPDIGDTGHTLGGAIGRSREVYEELYQAYEDPAYLKWLTPDRLDKGAVFSTFESLFRPALAVPDAEHEGRLVPKQKSRLLAGYGLGILNNASDKTAVVLNYGKSVYHYHNDFLNVELFANGQKMMPDFGYPDAMNAYVKELYTWSTNTVSHNTVVVDAQRQNRNAPGIVHDFASGGFARTIDASSQAYKQTSTYRRNLVMVDVDSAQSYVVDFFSVRGGKQHDYVLHGPPGPVTVRSDAISGKSPGALTGGEEVPWGHIYDDKALGIAGYAGSYSSYSGSGFQYLFNVERLKKRNHTIGYQHKADSSAHLRLHLIHQKTHETFLADAYDKPRAKKHLIKFVVVRNTGTDSLASTFLSVLEPHGGETYIHAVKEIEIPVSSAKAVEITRYQKKDIVISDTEAKDKKLVSHGISTDAGTAVLTFDQSGLLKRVFFSNGTYLRYRDRLWRNKPMKAVIEAIDYQNGEVRVDVRNKGDINSVAETPSVIHFASSLRTTVHPVESVRKAQNKLFIKVKDDLIIGKVSVHSHAGSVIRSENSLPLHAHYKGAYLLDASFREIGVIEMCKNSEIRLKEPVKVPLDAGTELWIANIGHDDDIEIKSVFSEIIR